MRVLAGLLSVLIWTGPGSAQDDVPSTGTFVGDARAIITSDKGDVRIWDRRPRVTILYQDPQAPEIMSSILDEIEAAVESPFGPTFFGERNEIRLPDDLGARETPLRMRLVRSEALGGEVHLYFGPDVELRTDIVVAAVDRQALAILNGLWGLNPRYTRSQMELSEARCYYQTLSRDGRRYGAYVSILMFEGKPALFECFWEEFLHTLGPLTDAKGSAFFTFDDSIGVSEDKQRNDIALIRALYESGVQPGDPPDRALEYLEHLIAARAQ